MLISLRTQNTYVYKPCELPLATHVIDSLKPEADPVINMSKLRKVHVISLVITNKKSSSCESQLII